MLLVVQAANALLASVPQVVAFQALGGAIGSLGLLFLASGVWREWRWAWRAVVLVEVLMLLGTAPRLVQALVAQQMPDGGWLLGCIGLPVGVLVSRRIKGDVPLVAGLLVASAVLHLALAGEHGLAFALDGVLLLGALRWRWAAPWVLVFNLVAYGVAVGPGKEAVDALGVSTKLLELVALGLVLGQSRRGTLALLASTVLVGGVAWAATFRDHGFAAHSHNPATASPPTYDERVAATALVQATKQGIARYSDVAAAEQAGYHLNGPQFGPLHYVNDVREHDDEVLEPTRPEGLVYVPTADGPLLVGALFIMPRLGLAGPTPGGPITHWHTHNVCIGLPPLLLAGLATPVGACPPGSINVTTPEMMHVWTIDNPGGPYADELDKAFIARLSRGSSADLRAARPGGR